MLQINSDNCGVIGPFNEVITLSDRYYADGQEYSFLVLGDSRVEQFIPTPENPEQVPKEITMRQARLALLYSGKLSMVNSAIESMPEPTKSAATIEWEYSNTVLRHNGFVSQLGPLLGLTEEQIDQLFILGNSL